MFYDSYQFPEMKLKLEYISLYWLKRSAWLLLHRTHFASWLSKKATGFHGNWKPFLCHCLKENQGHSFKMSASKWEDGWSNMSKNCWHGEGWWCTLFATSFLNDRKMRPLHSDIQNSVRLIIHLSIETNHLTRYISSSDICKEKN